jgi:hypothetical protein
LSGNRRGCHLNGLEVTSAYSESNQTEEESNMKQGIKAALNGIANGESDFATAEAIFTNRECGRVVTIAAARLADDMAEALVSDGGASNKKAFETIANGRPAFARMLASFGAMAAELRRLQDQNEEQKRSLQLMEGAERRRVEAVAELRSMRDKLDSVAYDVGELPARFISGDVPAAASLIRALPDIRQAIADADSVLGDNPDA